MLLKNKKGLIIGLLSNLSIGWGIAKNVMNMELIYIQHIIEKLKRKDQNH